MKHNWRRCIRAALGGVVLLLGLPAAIIGIASPAYADDLGYPSKDMPCVHSPYATTGTGYWCTGYQWGTNHDDVSGASLFSSRGYVYRNCTDYVAWKLQSLGVADSWTRGLGNGGEWYDNAANKTGLERGTTPKVGDAAVVPSDTVGFGGFGHVAYVEAVNADGTITVSEYNFHQDGAGGMRTGTPASMHFTEFIHFGAKMTNPPNNPPTGYQPRRDLAWYDGSAIYGFQAPGMATVTAAFGYSAPGWAGAGDYDNDRKEDLYWYDANSTTIYLLRGDHFTYAQPLRGPGLGAPVWAATGDFSGDKRRDQIVWYDGSGLFLFTGGNLATTWSITGYSAPTWAGVGDYNRDGKDDIYWYLGNTGSLYVMTSTGSGFNGAQLLRSGLGAPQWAGVGDFDGDNFRNDVAWYSGGTLYTFEGSCLCTTSSIVGYSQPTWAGVGDYNNDHKDDVYWYLGNSGTIYVIPSNGPSFNGAFSVRGPGIGAPVWAGTGGFNG